MTTNTMRCLILTAVLLVALPVLADTVILHDGSSYSGRLTKMSNDMIAFTDTSGVQYKFPVGDVQTMVFTSTADTVTLRNGKVYSGRYQGPNPISFQDAEGNQFPRKDVESLVFSRSGSGAASKAGHAKVIPEGTEVSVRTDEPIDSATSSSDQLYSATVSEDVADNNGAIAIPQGSPAKLLVRNITGGGEVHNPELVLDLFSVNMSGKEYRVVTSDIDINNRKGVGTNRRTAEFAGGGAGLGALVGAVFGGGKGAAIGAASGAGGGLLTQILTRGKKVQVPAESLLIFRLDRTLVFRPHGIPARQ